MTEPKAMVTDSLSSNTVGPGAAPTGGAPFYFSMSLTC